jgi:hypothetical protein
MAAETLRRIRKLTSGAKKIQRMERAIIAGGKNV